MFLVPDRRGGREEEGACDHGGEKGEAEEEERVLVESGAVEGWDGVLGE